MASMLEVGRIEDGAQDIVSVTMTKAAIAQKRGNDCDVFSDMHWQQVSENLVQKKPPCERRLF